MNKIVTVIFIVLGFSTIISADINRLNKYWTSERESASYEGDSGRTYQYDMGNSDDRAKYSSDVAAQERDRINEQYDYSNDRTQDRENGQYGSGVY